VFYFILFSENMKEFQSVRNFWFHRLMLKTPGGIFLPHKIRVLHFVKKFPFLWDRNVHSLFTRVAAQSYPEAYEKNLQIHILYIHNLQTSCQFSAFQPSHFVKCLLNSKKFPVPRPGPKFKVPPMSLSESLVHVYPSYLEAVSCKLINTIILLDMFPRRLLAAEGIRWSGSNQYCYCSLRNSASRWNFSVCHETAWNTGKRKYCCYIQCRHETKNLWKGSIKKNVRSITCFILLFFVVYLTTLSISQTIYRWMVGWLVNNER
jgi:hypothetical protein